jgi:hypothetical protein
MTSMLGCCINTCLEVLCGVLRAGMSYSHCAFAESIGTLLRVCMLQSVQGAIAVLFRRTAPKHLRFSNNALFAMLLQLQYVLTMMC